MRDRHDTRVASDVVDVHLRNLRYFAAVAEELHFTRAAERLFVSQPALSRQVAGLERALRTPLLERDTRSVTLTAAGEALLPAARRVLEIWEDGQRDVAEAAARATGRLVVGLATGIGRGLVSRAAQRLREDQPELALTMRQVPWDDPSVGLRERQTDVAFAFLPLPDDAGLTWQVLRTEARQVALPADHPLVTRERLVFTDLLDEPFLAMPSGPGRDFWLAADQRAGSATTIASEVRSADEAFEAVAGGVGVVLVAEGNAELYRREGVVVRDVADLSPAELVVVWRSNDQRASVAAFVDACSVELQTGDR